MNDKAIEWFEMLKSKFRDTEFENYLAKAIEALKQTRWIPAINNPPKTDESVLVTDGTNMFVAWYIEEWQEWDSDDSCFEKNAPIIAWMPLPKQYMTESEGKK